MSGGQARYPTVDFFCGAGGLSLGLRSAGLTPVFAFDHDPYACATYRTNIGAHVLEADAASITAASVCEATNLRPGDFALVCGGPPCQGFSVQRRGEADDTRNELVIRFAQIAVDLRPSVILMENVPPLLGKRGEMFFAGLSKLYQRAGYRIEARVLDAADFGVPQHRTRAIVLAWSPERIPILTLPRPTVTPNGYRTVRDAIGSMPEPPEDFTEHPDFRNHVRIRITKINEERIRRVPEGGGRADLPPELQLPCHRETNHRHLDVYGRMSWDKPAPTITAMFDSFTRGRFGHPVSDRTITAREGARLQSFPDSFVFVGPKKDVARQIGNAVPPLLAESIGRTLVAAFENRPVLDRPVQAELSLE